MDQTYNNWEIIIVDDKSSDDSHLIYDKYKNDSKIHIYYNEQNMGCGYTKRRCAELANGEICGFWDADDMLLPHALAFMVELHQKHLDVSVIFSRFYYCDENMNIIGENRKLQIKDGCSYLTNKDYAPECFAAYKNEFYKKTDGIDKNIKLGVDQDLYFRLEEVGKFYISHDLTYKVRVNMKSISRVDYGKADCWNAFVRYNACLRRNIPNYEDYSIKFLHENILKLKSRIEKKEKDINSIYNSNSYRVGNFLLKPLILMKNFFNSFHHNKNI